MHLRSRRQHPGGEPLDPPTQQLQAREGRPSAYAALPRPRQRRRPTPRHRDPSPVGAGGFASDAGGSLRMRDAGQRARCRAPYSRAVDSSLSVRKFTRCRPGTTARVTPISSPVPPAAHAQSRQDHPGAAGPSSTAQPAWPVRVISARAGSALWVAVTTSAPSRPSSRSSRNRLSPSGPSTGHRTSGSPASARSERSVPSRASSGERRIVTGGGVSCCSPCLRTTRAA